MKIKMSVAALNEALDVVSIVPPRAAAQDGPSGFLFVVRGGRCLIYSRDSTHQSRVEVPFDGDEEGSFIFPAEKVSALRFLDGWIKLESNSSEDRFSLKYETEDKAEQDLSTIDPRYMQALDAALEKTVEVGTYSVALLREAINATKSFMAKPNSQAEDHCKTIQLFDQSKDNWKKGDGHFFAADGVRGCFFFCEDLKGKALTVHGQHLPFLMSFLARSSGDVTVRQGDGQTFVVNSRNQVLGWAQSVKTHERFGYYALKTDAFVLRMPRDLLLKALRYVRAGLDASKDKIRVTYSHEERSLRFLASETAGKTTSRPVGVVPIEEEGGGGSKSATQDFAFNVSLNQLIDLFDSMRTNEADFRVAIVAETANRKESALFRTIDTFIIDANGKQLIAVEDAGKDGKAYQCQVTRFMPSRD